MSALAALPRLTASIGAVIAGNPDAAIEVLPGSPTTIMFVAGGRVRGLFVLPIDEDEARKVLRLPLPDARNPVADRLFEEGRQIDFDGLDLETADAC